MSDSQDQNKTNIDIPKPKVKAQTSLRFKIILPWFLLWNIACIMPYVVKLAWVSWIALALIIVSLLGLIAIRIKPSRHQIILRDGANFEEIKRPIEMVIILHTIIICLLFINLVG